MWSRRAAARCALALAAGISCGGKDATGAASGSVVVTTMSCTTVSDQTNWRYYEVTATGSASGPVGTSLTPAGGQGTGYSDPNKSTEPITDFYTADWSGSGVANVSSARSSSDPATTDFTVSFGTGQTKPVQARTVFIDMDLFLPNNGGRKTGAKTTTCQ